ncbi:MAG: aryl-sulfate sulfotransferase [Candidatus Thorarchaeota archaeon]
MKSFQRIPSHFVVIFVFFLFLHQSEYNFAVVDIESNFPKTKNISIQTHISNTTYEKPNLIKLNQAEDGVSVIHSGEAFEGYNIFQFRNFTDKKYDFRITDMEGNIIHEFPGNNTFSYGHVINSTTLLLRTTGGVYFWNIENWNSQRFVIGSHHDISYNPRTKTFMTLLETKVYNGQNPYRYDIIREVNMAGEVIWELHTNSFIPFSYWSGEFDGEVRDITHSNSIFWDIEEDKIYLLCRNLNTFFKIDHSTSEVLWGLGEYGNFTLFDQKGNQRPNLFYHAHALEKVDDNTFILFDNDYLNQTDLNDHQSQILEITIDETSMEAMTSWFWRGSPEFYTAYWGDADRLPNGNRFGVFGSMGHIDTAIGPRLVEVNESGHIVWEMNYKGGSIGIYNADRFRLNPILNSPEDLVIKKGDELTLSWQTWYNARTKLKMNGSFILYQDGEPIYAGPVVFKQFWLPTDLTFELGSSELGEYNFTLVVFDEGGHFVKDSVNVTIKYHIDRDGPIEIEQGQKYSIIRWRGITVPPVTGKIYVNNQLIKTFEWEGSAEEEEEFDLNSLIPGEYNISFQLFKLEELVFFDNFWVTIHSSSPPEIIDAPDDFWVWSNQTSVTLTWKVYDLTPHTYSIYINDLLFKTAPWNGSDIIFHYHFIANGTIHITLLLADVLGNTVEDNVTIEIHSIATEKTSYFSMIGLLGFLLVQQRRKKKKRKSSSI